MIHRDILVVGGGLCGFAIADHLERTNLSWEMFNTEAAENSPIPSLSVKADADRSLQTGKVYAEILPDDHHVIELVKRFGIDLNETKPSGHSIFQTEDGALHQDLIPSTKNGVLRLPNGGQSVIDALQNSLPPEKIQHNCLVNRIDALDRVMRLTVSNKQVTELNFAKTIILSSSLAISFKATSFSPPLPERLNSAFLPAPHPEEQLISITMKYQRPFWQDVGFSGDALSQKGPLVKITDCSRSEDSVGVLHVQFGAPDILQGQHWAALEQDAVTQVQDIFGLPWLAPIEILHEAPLANRSPGLLILPVATSADESAASDSFHSAWGGRLLVANSTSTELRRGTAEGALVVAESVASHLLLQEKRSTQRLQ